MIAGVLFSHAFSGELQAVSVVNEGAEVLGGEFFLADEGQIIRTWYAGKYAADMGK